MRHGVHERDADEKVNDRELHDGSFVRVSISFVQSTIDEVEVKFSENASRWRFFIST
jgi:hypothetical protein